MKLKRIIALLLALVIALMAMPISTVAEGEENQAKTMPRDGKLRRPISPEQPMWIVHIDTWNNADPDKIIDLIPEDVLPYVVFNISMSINYDHDTHTWGVVNDGYELAKSWLRTCAERQVWAMIQPASGGQCHFPDYINESCDGTLFEEFFRDYPNFLGYNYCEQFWGFEQEDFPITCPDRYRHFANLLKLTHDYGGYLVDSWCGNQWGQSINPMAMLKTVPEFEEAARTYTENFILCEKYTQVGYMHDQESYILGAWLSGYSGQYGIRYDETGWTSNDLPYSMSTGLSTQFEKLVKSGLTVIDGPELVPEDCFYEDRAQTDEDDYTIRKWQSYVQFKNVATDMFRKVIDGTIRIPTREEVIKNTKVAIVQDVEKGNDFAKYCTYPSLFTGLYQMDGDGVLQDNKNFYKKTGRYPTIPTVYAFTDDISKSFELIVNQSEFIDRWKTVDDKVEELNTMFPEESSGTIYAGRNKNTWVVYNPLKNRQDAQGSLTLQYNTAKDMDLTLSKYTTGVINEYSDSIDVYLNNFDNDSVIMLSDDVITINGCSEEPTVTYEDRTIDGMAPKVNSSYSNGSFTITVSHNGPIDLSIKVKGNETGKATDYNTASYIPPERPGIYYGDRQYEFELSEQKNIQQNVPNGCRTGVDKFVGQGYLIFGKENKAAARDTINTLESGKYNLSIRYALANANVSKLALYVNGRKVTNLKLAKTGSTSEWSLCTEEVSLKKGANTVELKSTGELEDTLYLDCMILGSERLGNASNPMLIIIIIIAVIAAIAIATATLLSKKKKAAK